MNETQRTVVLVELARQLKERGSWCGETHLQKASFLYQGLLDEDLGFDFTLYLYGPFSFDLRDKLGSLRADGLFELKPEVQFGPHLYPTDQAVPLLDKFPKTLAKRQRRIKFIADTVRDRGVSSLEKLATALWVTRELGAEASVDERAQAIVEEKPHVSIISARKAVEEIDELKREAEQLRAA